MTTETTAPFVPGQIVYRGKGTTALRVVSCVQDRLGWWVMTQRATTSWAPEQPVRGTIQPASRYRSAE